MKKQSKKRLSADELSVLCRQLAMLVRAGYPAGESVAMLESGAPSEGVRQTLVKLRRALDAGESLAGAMAQTEEFPDYALAMADIGQHSGRLEQVLQALSEYYRRESQTVSALRRAVGYPALMAALVVAVFAVLVWQVLPAFQRVFEQLGGAAGGSRLLFGPFGRGLAVALALLLMAAAAWAGLCMRRGRTPFARLFRRSAAGRAEMRGRFSSAMALMLSSGLPIDEALARAARLLRGTAAEGAAADCAARLNGGASLAAAAERSGLLTGLQAGLLSAGVLAGAADEAMREIAEHCREESDEGMQRLMQRFETVLLVLLCAVTGGLLLSVMLPLLGVLSAIGG